MADLEDCTDALNTLMKCAICLCPAENHRCLPCQHIFCQGCLEPLVSNNAILCPMCRRQCPLHGRGVDSLPRNLVLMNLMEQSCEECRVRTKSVSCWHCGKHLCSHCHDTCREEVTELKDQMETETTSLLSTGYQALHQLHQDTVRVHGEVTRISEQIDLTTQTIIETVLGRHQALKHELNKAGNAEVGRLNTQYQQLADHMKKLKVFMKESQTEDKQNVGEMYKLCQRWNEENNVTKTLCQTREEVSLEYVENHGDRASVSSLLGSLEIRHNTRTPTEHGAAERCGSSTSASRPQRVRSIDYSSRGVPREIFGGEGSSEGCFKYPSHAAVSPVSGNYVVCDNGNSRIQIYTNQGEFVSQFGSKGQNEGQFDFGYKTVAGGVAVTPEGVVVVADTDNHRLQKFSEQGTFLGVIGEKGTNPGQFRFPCGLSCDKSARISVCDQDNKRIQVMELNGSVVSVIDSDAVPGSWSPSSVETYPSGDIIVADSSWGKGKIEIFTSGGEHKTTLKHDKIKRPADMAVDGLGNIIVTDWDSHQVNVFSPQGEFLCSLGREGRKPGELRGPFGVTYTQDGSVLVVDKNNHRIQVF